MSGSGKAHLRGDGALLSVENLTVTYRPKGGVVQAVSDISFDVMPGETLGIVGESGCGKSTTGRAILGLDTGSTGSVVFGGEHVDGASTRRMRELRREMQMIFQDPVGSLNPRRQVRKIVVEGLDIAGVPAAERASVSVASLTSVGLGEERFADMLPHQLSGGQAQRVAIARALAVGPKLLVCDEPISSLDVSVQAQILNLIEDVKAEHDLTVIFIAHDLGVVHSVSDNVMVMYLGTVCEYGDASAVYANPAHPYTRALLDSVPTADHENPFAGPPLEGDVPSPLSPPSGCRFSTRCPRATSLCSAEAPELQEVAPKQFAACHHPLPPVAAVVAPVAVELGVHAA